MNLTWFGHTVLDIRVRLVGW